MLRTTLSSTTALLSVIAICELTVGALLLLAPSWTSHLLLGAGLALPEAVLVARMAGAALFSIGLICWLSRMHHGNRQAIGLIAGLLAYNAAAVALLVYARFVERINGIGILPTVGLHLALLMWCAVHLWLGSPAGEEADPP